LAILGVLIAWPVFADDTSVTLGAGGLVPMKSSDNTMESEDLQISTGRIEVKSLFRNNSDRDIVTLVAFPLPELDGGLLRTSIVLLPSGGSVNFVDFALKVNRRATATKTDLRAFWEGQDITTHLRSLGLPISVLDKGMDAAIGRLAPAIRRGIEKEELIIPINDPHESRKWSPEWANHVNFYWSQRFPRKSAIEVEHTYRPVVGVGDRYRDIDQGFTVKQYCGGPDDVDRIEREKRAHPEKHELDTIWTENYINFVLKTARNWAGPIGRFHLTVLSDSPNDIALTCLPGLKKASPVRYELRYSDFRPDRDLDLLIIQFGK